MTRPSAIRSAWTIMSGIWLRQRRSIVALLGVTLGGGFVLRFVSAENGFAQAVGNAGLALSLGFTFILCGFTETNPKTGVSGFPARLFTAPLSTSVLVAAPMVFGVLLIAVVYAVWAEFALAARDLPLTWPLLYLAAGMISYQSIVWSLARFRVARIVVLGYAGALFAMGWLAFRGDPGGPLASDLSDGTRTLLSWGLVAIGAVAQLVAWFAVDAQRRGGFRGVWRAAKAATRDGPASIGNLRGDSLGVVTRQRRRFASAFDAQFWFEWRRHGKVLPWATAGVLFIIMIPGLFVRPVSSGMTTLALGWILATPLLIAFVLGKGLGKPDLWSGDSKTPPFVSTRPLGDAQWIGAKLKMGTASALVTWLGLTIATTAWLWFCCDCAALSRGWTMLERSYSAGRLYGAAGAMLLILILLTFRFLAGSLYVGLSGRKWLMNLSACGVFTLFFSGIFAALAIANSGMNVRWIVNSISTATAVLFVIFAVKVAATLLLVRHGLRERRVSLVAAGRHAVIWIVATGGLAGGVWSLPLVDGRWKVLLVALSLFVMPMLRLSLAPIALARRSRI